MATLPTSNLTMLDLANRMDPNGKVPKIVEMLNEMNEILDDMVWKEGNLPTGHRTKIRTGLPQGTWRRLNGGIKGQRSTTAGITHTCGMLEALSEIDCVEADLNGNTSAFRLSEDRPFLEGINQQLADSLFYANEKVTPEKFTGLAPYYNTFLNSESAENMIDAGGVGGDNASIWLVVWGDETCHGIVPKGMPAGIQHEDLGKKLIDVFDASNTWQGKMMAYLSHYRLFAGLTVKDWRYVVRIANVDKSLLTKDASGGADIIDLMTQALEIPPSLTIGKPCFYVPKTIRSMLRRQIVNKVANSTLSMDTVAGRRTVIFDTVPVRTCAALSPDEARVI